MSSLETRNDFQIRWETERQSAKIDGYEVRYVSIHAFGDEVDLLKKLEIGINECTYVGCYIELGINIFFVEFNIEKEMIGFFKNGIYVRINEDRIYSKSIVNDEYLVIDHLNKWIKYMLNFNVAEKSMKEIVALFDIEKEYTILDYKSKCNTILIF